MKAPILEQKPETLELDPEWKVFPHFTVRPEPFGYLLARVNWSVPVTRDAKPLVDMIDGTHTLEEFHTRFGDEALDFIGHLYQEGCVEFGE